MHAILALGASHLARLSPESNCGTTAIVRRGQAIKGLNEALAKESRGYGESDALLAACYALTFQSSYMGDGMADFITLVRGCALVTQQIHNQETHTAFNLERDIHFRLMEPRLEQMPTLDPALITPAIISVEALRPLLRTTMDHHFHAALLSVLFALQQSSRAGYLNFCRAYGTFFDMSHDQFNVFIDIHNTPSQLLMAHFICLQLLMVPLLVHEWPGRNDASKARTLLGTVEWGEKIFARTPLSLNAYAEWPKMILGTVRREVEALDTGAWWLIDFRILDSKIR